MNVSTLTISAEEASRKLDQYRATIGKRRLKEDDELESLYRTVKNGGRVLNLVSAFKQTGLNEKGEPRLAIARADWPDVWFHPCKSQGRGTFTPSAIERQRATAINIRLPRMTFEPKYLIESYTRLNSPVPHIPPECRPKFKLSNYHILFEVKEWKSYPRDPFLLRRIGGFLFIVEAEWDLTELEAELLASLRAGN